MAIVLVTITRTTNQRKNFTENTKRPVNKKGEMYGWWRETIDIVKENDPAARTTLEVLLTYPGVKVLAAHRLSHFSGNMVF